MKQTTNLKLRKPDYNDLADISDINYNMDLIDSQLGEKVKYTDLTPITTTGTSSAYIATIPENITEVSIVPHINNLVGATLNSVPILDREGKPIEKDVLKINIPTKLVRVGSNFFLSSGGGGSFNVPKWFDKKKGVWVKQNDVYPNHSQLGSCIDAVNDSIYINSNYFHDCYDTITNTWSEKTKYTRTMKDSASCAVGSSIYYIGGDVYSSLDPLLNRCYDTVTDTWSEKTKSPIERSNATTSAINDIIYCIGGVSGSASAYCGTNICYDITTNTWTYKANNPAPRKNLTSVAVGNKIYCIGGTTGSDSKKVECYDTITNTWTTKANIVTTESTNYIKAVELKSKIYYHMGNTLKCYDIDTNTWSESNISSINKSGVLTAIIANAIYCFGGTMYNDSVPNPNANINECLIL